MKEKNKLRIIQILCVISLLITGFSIQMTYAKYYETVGTIYSTHIKRWAINVNEKYIHESATLNEVMNPVIVENEHMNNNNTLVPGREGYFDFTIDYSSVDLAFQFAFEIEQLNTKQLEDFEVYGYTVIDGENITTVETTDLATINPIIDPVTNKITLSNPPEGFNPSLDADKKVDVRVLFRWNDANSDTEDSVEVGGMNNIEDTIFVGEINGDENGEELHKLLKYNVKITFTQYIAPKV